VPAELWIDAARMATSGLLVGMVAVPVGLFAWAARPLGEPLLPRWRAWRVPWSGFEVIAAFFVVSLLLPVMAVTLLDATRFFQEVYDPNFPRQGAKDVPPEELKEASTLRMLWANLFALPVALALLWFTAKALYPKWKPALSGTGSISGKVALAVLAWLAIAPIVLVFNTIVNAVAQQFDVMPDTHSLTKLGGRPLMDQVLFAFEACIAAPLREEIVFRGILLAWCVGRMKIPGAGVQPLTAARPWFVMISAVALAFVLGEHRAAPVAFAALLAVGLAVLWRFQRTGARRVRAVYATAALFAVVHSSVWPNPVPLFALGLGLGWLAVRTNGVLVPVIVHGLFNAVSVAFVLRG
jgi:membrane protease YdiL (CAAX protease family)